MELFDIIINFVEGFICSSFIYFVLKKENSSFLSLCIMTCIYSINITIHNYFLLPEISLTITGLIIACVYAFYLNKNGYIQNIFVILCELIFLSISVSCAMLLTSLFFKFPFYSGFDYIFLVISSKVINAIIVYYSIKFIHVFNLLQTKKLNYVLLAILLLELIYSSLMDIIYYNSIFNEYIVAILFSIIFLTLFLVIVFLETKKEQKELVDLQRNYMQLETQEKITKVNSENLKELKKWKHDILHVFNSLSYELDLGHIGNAKKIINEYSHTLDNHSILERTGNSLLDYILVQKNKDVQEKCISLYVSYSALSCPIHDTHFFIIAGNLLNNAIENCISNNQKEIYLTFHQNGPYFCMKIKNSIISPVLKNNPNLISTKDDPDNHGIGLTNVKLLLKKYNGQITFEEDQYFFTAKVIIPMDQSNEE